jgi:hypothetical protein
MRERKKKRYGKIKRKNKSAAPYLHFLHSGCLAGSD